MNTYDQLKSAGTPMLLKTAATAEPGIPEEQALALIRVLAERLEAFEVWAKRRPH